MRLENRFPEGEQAFQENDTSQRALEGLKAAMDLDNKSSNAISTAQMSAAVSIDEKVRKRR